MGAPKELIKRQEWLRKLQNSWNKGKTGVYSIKTLQLLSEATSANIGEKSSRWQSDISKLSYKGLHWRIKSLYGLRPAYCEDCGKIGSFVNSIWSIEWSNNSGSYNTVDRFDWTMRCKSCHRKYDNSQKNITITNSCEST